MYEEIALKFGHYLEFEKLAGGQNTSYRFGDFTLKPISDLEKYSWMGESLQSIEVDGIDIARPLKSKFGNWTEDDLGATKFYPGEFTDSQVAEKLRAAEIFHRATQKIIRPIEFSSWSSPWTFASEVAWKEAQLPEVTLPSTRGTLEKVFQEYNAIELPSQFIHSDLAGNILFHNSRPVIIDISPDFRPKEYACAMLVTDSIAWYNAPIDSIDLLPFSDILKRQLILRAVAFRLCVPVFFDPLNGKSFELTLSQFRSVLDHVGARI